MIFLCEHETQGIAYQQALSCDVPILAWDQGGYWLDPGFFPDKVKFAGVTSVPYWSQQCGIKFEGIADFDERLDEFLAADDSRRFTPREFIVGNLSLEKCAKKYVDFVTEINTEL
jgi:glycosyltransferase involved in cell wall biosynthesis